MRNKAKYQCAKETVFRLNFYLFPTIRNIIHFCPLYRYRYEFLLLKYKKI